MPRRILVVEDNKDMAQLLALHLHDMSCQVELVYDGMAGLAKAESSAYDLIILDVMLPKLDGLEVCRQLRRKPIYTPILMLTSKATELDRVLGLEIGADDYVTKPFSIMELLARVKAILRRMENIAAPNPTPKENPLILQDLNINFEKRQVTLQGENIELTAKEFELLAHFARCPGRVYSRAQLLDTVWGYGHDGYEHTVNSHINRLRAKIEKNPAEPRFILTVWGIGYKFADQEM